MVDLATIQKDSHFLVLLLPLNPATRHLVDREFLADLPPDAILINVCRGSVVDEEAIADAIDAGQLAGYAADVFELEDWALPDRPRSIPARLLENEEQTFFTPHLGSAVDEVRIAITLEAATQLKAFFAGEQPTRALNPEVMVSPDRS